MRIARIITNRKEMTTVPAHQYDEATQGEITRVFVRRDGWTLAASKGREAAARKMWEGEWEKEYDWTLTA